MLGVLTLVTGRATPLPWDVVGSSPALAFETRTFDDGSLWRCLTFTSVAGVNYQVESSDDLRSWITDTTVHGLGHEIVVPMFETIPPPPVPPVAPPGSLPAPAPPSPSVSLTVRPVSGGGIELGWRSLESGSAQRHHFPLLSLDSGWDMMPFFCDKYGGHWFLIFKNFGTADPVMNGEHGSLDQAMLADFEANWSDMDAAVAASAAASAHATPSPPASGGRRFWRVRADWSIDSDLDFTPDWAEFAGMAAAAQGTGPDLAYDAFSEDADQSGIPDGEERSRDGDSIPDAFDAEPDDPGVDWQKVLPWRYALFSAGVRTEPDNDPMPPLQINDQGVVLYPFATWRAGEFSTLPLEKTDEIEACRAMGMNDLGVIVGIGQPLRQPVDGAVYTGQGTTMPSTPAVAWWQNRVSDPIPVEVPHHFAESVWFDAPDEPFFSHDKLIANDGRFVAWRRSADSPFPRIDATWKRSGNGFVETPLAGLPEGFQPAFVTDPQLVWGPHEGGTLLRDGSGDVTFGAWYPRFARTPSERIAAVVGTANVHYPEVADPAAQPQGWVRSPSMDRLVDLAENGIGIRSLGTLWMNGRIHPLSELAPDIPESWEFPRLRDLSPSGWMLADRDAGTGTEGLVGMPLLASPVFSLGAEGVDDFSIRSPEGSLMLALPPGSPPEADPYLVTDPAVAYRAWVMAPQETTKDFRLTSQASPENPLTLTFTGATSGGSNEVTVTSPDTLIPLTGDSGVESGSDFTVALKLGDEPSLSEPIGIKVMKRRTVRVAAYRIGLQTAGGGVIAPTLTPSQADITSRLDAVFLPQINAGFDVRLAPDPLNVAFDLDSDGALTGEAGDALGEYTALDSAVAQYRASNPFSLDAEGEAWDPHITIFFIGASQWIVDEDSLARGKTVRSEAKCYIVASEIVPGPPALPSAATLQRTIPHEVGHVLVGYGHPDEYQLPPSGYGGEAPLPGTDHRRRLMASGKVGKLGPVGDLLVKKEWDEAESWLKLIVDTPQQNQ